MRRTSCSRGLLQMSEKHMKKEEKKMTTDSHSGGLERSHNIGY